MITLLESNPPPAGNPAPCVEGEHYVKQRLQFYDVTLRYNENDFFSPNDLLIYPMDPSPIKFFSSIITPSYSSMDTYYRPYINISKRSKLCVDNVSVKIENYMNVGGVYIDSIPYFGMTSNDVYEAKIKIASVQFPSGGRLIWEGSFNKPLNNMSLSLTAAYKTGTTRGGYDRDDDYRGNGGIENGFITRGETTNSTGRGTSTGGDRGGTTGGTGRGETTGSTGRGTGNSGSSSSDEDNTGNFSDDGRIIITAEQIEGWVVVPNTLLEKLIPESVTLEEGTILEPIHNPTLERPIYVGNDFDSDVIYDMPLQIVEP